MNPKRKCFYLLLIGLVFLNFQAKAQSVTISSNKVNNEFCYGSNATLIGEVEGIENPQYQWLTNSEENMEDFVSIPNAKLKTYNISNLIQSRNYKLSVSWSENGENFDITSAKLEIKVYDELVAGLISGGQEDIICSGEDAGTLTADPTGSSGNYDYKWYKNNVENTSETEVNYSVGPLTETTTFFYRVIDAECGGKDSDPITIEVYPEFLAGSILSTVTYPICSGNDAGTLTADPTGGSGTYDYKWYKNNVENTSETEVNYSVGPLTETTTFFYRVIDAECSGKDSDPITIVVHPELTAGDITGGNTPICSGEDAGTLTVRPSGGSGSDNYTYEWFKIVDVPISVGTEVNYSVGPLAETATFYYKVTDAECEVSVDSPPEQLDVNPLPNLVGTEAELWVKNNPDIESQPLVLIVCCAESGSNYSYKWFLSDNDNDVEIPGETGQYYYNENGFEPGIYYAIVENEFGCTVETKHENLNGLKEFYVGNETDLFVIYPNPSNGQFEVRINELNSEFDISSITINIYSVTGERIYSELFDYSNTYIQLSNLSSGMYYLELRDQNGQKQIEKLIIQ